MSETQVKPARVLQVASQMPMLLFGITVGRLLLVPVIIVSFGAAQLVTIGTLTAFVIADLFDGVVARRYGADDPGRRTLDSLIDRFSIWPVYVAVTLSGFLPLLFLVALVTRDLYCGHCCYRIIRERMVVIKADWLYRALNLSLAIWVGIAPFTGNQVRTGSFLAILAFSALVAFDLRRSAEVVRRLPDYIRFEVVPAGELRAMHRSLGVRRLRSA